MVLAVVTTVVMAMAVIPAMVLVDIPAMVVVDIRATEQVAGRVTAPAPPDMAMAVILAPWVLRPMAMPIPGRYQRPRTALEQNQDKPFPLSVRDEKSSLIVFQEWRASYQQVDVPSQIDWSDLPAAGFKSPMLPV